jgi:NADH-quinone oxidoreductase subunit L
MLNYYLVIVLAPLIAAIAAGLFGKQIGRAGSHWITIVAVGLSCALSMVVLKNMVWGGAPSENISLYTWAVTDGLRMEVGFLVDRLTALMMAVVTFVSFMVHIYTVGYMRDDPGYERFFSFISLFTFSMLMLVMSNNFLQLFFGWEAVGLVSYLLIGFWFKRESAIIANLKAFLVNRVGDFGYPGYLWRRHVFRFARLCRGVRECRPYRGTEYRTVLGYSMERDDGRLHPVVYRCHG